MKKKLSYFLKCSLVLTLGSIFMNPSLGAYESHEVSRFKDSSAVLSLKTLYCNHQAYDSSPVVGSIDVSIYYDICGEVVSELVNSPEKLSAVIHANTTRSNFFVLSNYVTNYSEIYKNTIERVQEHPSYNPSSERRGGVPGGRAADLLNSIEVIGLFGYFIDTRTW